MTDDWRFRRDPIPAHPVWRMPSESDDAYRVRVFQQVEKEAAERRERYEREKAEAAARDELPFRLVAAMERLAAADGRVAVEPAPISEPECSGPEGGCWVRLKGKRYAVPKGVVYKFIEYMWDRDSATYNELDGTVFDGDRAPQTIRSAASKVNLELGRIRVPWKLACNSVDRFVTKKIKESLNRCADVNS